MIRQLLFSLMAMLLLVATPSLAGTLKKSPPTLNPTKAYVVVEIGKVDDGLLYGSLILSRYDSARGDIADQIPPTDGKAVRAAGSDGNRIYLLKSAIKSGGRSLFLVEMDPGLWVIEGANDTAFSLGSKTVRLDIGSVIDLGVVKVYSDFAEGQKRDVLTSGRLLKGALVGGIFGRTIPQSMPKAIEIRTRLASDIALPPVFAAAARPVEWAGEVRFGNHLGGLVNRMGGRKARPGALGAGEAATGSQGATQPAPSQ